MAAFTRRRLLAAAPALAVTPVLAAAPAPGGAAAWDFAFPAIEGGDLRLAAYRGKALMVVNTASFCGFTYQYEALERLHRARAAAGLVVIGVPSRDFNQESDSNAKVKTFCETAFGVDFPLAAISHVRGPEAAPFYRWVKAERGWQPSWNFNKVVIGRDGGIVGCFGSTDEPEGPAVTAAIGRALAAAA